MIKAIYQHPHFGDIELRNIRHPGFCAFCHEFLIVEFPDSSYHIIDKTRTRVEMGDKTVPIRDFLKSGGTFDLLPITDSYQPHARGSRCCFCTPDRVRTAEQGSQSLKPGAAA